MFLVSNVQPSPKHPRRGDETRCRDSYIKGCIDDVAIQRDNGEELLVQWCIGPCWAPAAASRQSRLPPGFLLVPRFYALHDRTAALVQENADLKSALDKLTCRVLELEAFKESSTKSAKDDTTLPDPGTPPTEGPRTPPYGEASLTGSAPSAPRKRRAPSPEPAEPAPKRRYLPGHAPSRFAPGPLPNRPLPECLITRPSNEEN